MDFYLDKSRASDWAEIQKLAAADNAESDEKLTRYLLEGYRLANSLALLRDVAPGHEVTIQNGPAGPVKVHGGDHIFISFVSSP